MRNSILSLSIILLLLSTACTVHRVDVQQGNVITKEMVDQLKQGMTKRQVQFVMGSPSIEDPFHQNRWDYIFTMQPGHIRKIIEQKRVVVLFEADKAIKVDITNVSE